jgi:hypothetical protein
MIMAIEDIDKNKGARQGGRHRRKKKRTQTVSREKRRQIHRHDRG